MAILSNGKFYGYLCSVKYTGKKLVNGVKEYVEDFVSGFAGHGWKLWKNKGAWKLELDELVIRKTFTAFEMIISQIRAIRGSQTISQGFAKVKDVTIVNSEVYESGVLVERPCYRLEIEDEINSIMEYDLVKCIKDNREYFVEVGSVFQFYINIPITAFDVDESGFVITPPLPGDEIIQFGNTSKEEKYKNRHSAIYMHVDENEPAIDFMTGLYSKDWTSAIKTRIGGNLPGTDGESGFYCVNGKIISVDEKNEIVYEINPDGSASFARGKLKWTKDGSPQFSGSILVTIDNKNVWEVNENCVNIIGNKEGKRVEIAASSSDIKIFNAENKQVISLEGNEYKFKDFFSSDYDYVEKNIPNTKTTKGTDWENNSFTYIQHSNIIKNNNPALSYIYQPNVLYSTNSETCSLEYTIGLSKYDDNDELIDFIPLMSRAFGGITNEHQIGIRGQVSIPVGNYSVSTQLYLRTKKGSADVAKVTLNSLNGELVSTQYFSKFYSNGIILADSSNNMFSVNNETVLNSGNPLNKEILFNCFNNNFGIKFDNSKILLKRGEWGIPMTCLCYGTAKYENSKFTVSQPLSSFDGNMPTVGDSGGVYMITPPEWGILTDANCIVLIYLKNGGTGASMYLEAPLNRWLISLSTKGSFVFEIRRL